MKLQIMAMSQIRFSKKLKNQFLGQILVNSLFDDEPGTKKTAGTCSKNELVEKKERFSARQTNKAFWSILSGIFFVFLLSSNSFAGGFLDNFSLKFPDKKREHIAMVGSSTVYPFAATIAETFGRDTNFKTPVVEATGTGGGFKLFCAGIGYQFPDFANASRPITENEKEICAQNGISVEEIKIGYDGIVLANSLQGERYHLSRRQIFLALAAKIADQSGKLIDNPFKLWSQIDKNLPNKKIAIYGPPPSSGTRDSFVELVMEHQCDEDRAFINSFLDKKIRQKKCRIIRFDGAFIEAGENDNLIIQKLNNDPDALGIFGYSFLAENESRIAAAKIDESLPNVENIASGAYPISRPLFIYAKKEHFDLIPGMREFIAEITNKNTLGIDGYLLQKGLVPIK